MRRLSFLFISLSCFAQIPVEEEALSLRRIADFWQEGEYELAKNQMEQYLHKFPDSNYYDTLCVALGDLCLREKNYGTALNYYSRITSSEWKDSVFLSRMQCLYYLEWYATLADECDEFLARNIENDSKTQATYYLAIGLYQQCLNAKDNPDQLESLALRARPHFTTLLESERSSEVSQAFAYLCCILKEYPKASDIYLELANQDEQQKEHLLFQAALLQAQFDKEKAATTFREINQLKKTKSKDAAFNYLVINFELGKHEKLIVEKEELLKDIDSSQMDHAHLLFGQSYLQTENYPKAIEELSLFVDADLPYSTLRPGLIFLLKAAHRENHLTAIEKAIDKLDTQDVEYPQALFVRSMILKKEGRLEEATSHLIDLLASHSDFPQKSQALFELIDLEYQSTHWKSCRSHAKWFLELFPSHDLIAAAWRYLASSSAQLSSQEDLDQRSLKKQFAADLERLFKHSYLFPKEELLDWQFLLAKTYYEIHDYKKSLSALEVLLKQHSFSQLGNAYLLMALLQKDRSLKQFCLYAEKALSIGADLVENGQVHIALFNAYLEQSKETPSLIEQAAEHLFLAFTTLGSLQTENLNWLASYYYAQAETNSLAAERAATLLENSVKTPVNAYKLAKLYSQKNRVEEQVALLESVKDGLDLEAKLLLAEGYLQLENKEAALELFDAIVAASPTNRSHTSASASLEAIRLKKSAGKISLEDAASGLKNLILQRRLANEPVHLEAALEYVALLSAEDSSKQLSLLKKTKADFEATDTLLSKDYQESRAKLTAKNQIYEMYLLLFDVDMCLCEAKLTEDILLKKHWRAKAKEILLQIMKDPVENALLGKRVSDRLEQLKIDESNS